MKINFACGKQTFSDFYCIDAVQHPKATREIDLLHTFRFDAAGNLENPLPLSDEAADELHSYHFIEHVYQWEAPAVLLEFRRLLKPGGRLILELPDLEKACRNLLKGSRDQMSMWPLYGDPGHKDTYMCHRWGYTPATIKMILKETGFKNVNIALPKTHGGKKARDMRVEANR